MIARAREILRRHEQSEEKLTAELSPGAGATVAAQQTAFTALDGSVVEALRSADLNKLTPIEAMNLLAALQKQLS